MTDLPPGYRQIPKKINIAGELIDRIEERSFEERTAFIWDGGSITFAAFGERVNRLAHGLSGYGIERGMPVLVRMHNCIEFAETVQALLMMGALPVMQNSLLGEEEIKYDGACFWPRWKDHIDIKDGSVPIHHEIGTHKGI